MRSSWQVVVLVAWATAGQAQAGQAAPAGQAARDAQAECRSLTERLSGKWPLADTEVESLQWQSAGPLSVPGGPGAPPRSLEVPAHCELIASLQSRHGTLGQDYRIRFHLRLPADWNGRFFFMGGGGSNGALGDALGRYAQSAPAALLQGYAVVSQDSGHDNARNVDQSHEGTLVFGFDPLARRNYGDSAIPLVTDASKEAIKAFYGQPARRSYFVGCSKGGEEAMAVSQRYADRFDGIVAGAPGMSLPRAALAEAWDTQAFAHLLPTEPGQPPRVAALHTSFSDDELALASRAVLAACDRLDGVEDGLVADVPACTTERVAPALHALACQAGTTVGCLANAKIDTLLAVMGGVHDSTGKALYAAWPWDAGIADPGWRMWKIGGASGNPPALNVVLGGASLAAVFTTPPTALPADPQALFEFLLHFDFDRDAPRIYATGDGYEHSAWQDISARSPDLDLLRSRGGRLLVWQGASDPVFSLNDTIGWWNDVHARYRGEEAGFLRLLPIPGMGHCGGGAAVGDFDPLRAVVKWVEQGDAPDALIARAGAGTPWPGRERPLCAWPKTAHYLGKGDIEAAASFECR